MLLNTPNIADKISRNTRTLTAPPIQSQSIPGVALAPRPSVIIYAVMRAAALLQETGIEG